MHKIDTTYCQPANLIPHFWHYKIVDKEGRPDLPCIMILAEILGWYRSLTASKTSYCHGKSLPELVDGSLVISYEYLTNKLNLHKERIRRKLVRLESLGVLTRTVRNISSEDYANNINQLCISIDQGFFERCFRRADLDIRIGENEAHRLEANSFKSSPPYGGDHISKKNKIRFNESSFFKNCFLGLARGKTLAEFYPLNKEDVLALQGRSGREFGVVAVNEILLKLSTRHADHSFASKAAFMAYMTKVLAYAMRDAVKISNENFKLNCNVDRRSQEQEKYLDAIESSIDNDPIARFKRKIASALSAESAYEILRAVNIYINPDDKRAIMLQSSKSLTISPSNHNLLLHQARAVWGDNIEKIQLCGVNYAGVAGNKGASPAPKPKTTKPANQNIWQSIRANIVSYIGDDGRAIDNNWFSKLEAKVNEDEKNITLSAPSSFIKDWVQEKYGELLNSFCKQQNFNLVGLV